MAARRKRKLADMFYDFENLNYSMRTLCGIVQNENLDVSEDELMNWCDDINSVINKLNSLKEDVIRYYQD